MDAQLRPDYKTDRHAARERLPRCGAGPRPASRQIALLHVSLALSLALVMGNIAAAKERTVAEINQLLSAGQFGQAAEALRSIDDAITAGTRPADVDLTFPLAIAARSFEQQQEIETAADLFQRSIQAAARDAAQQLPIEKVTMVRLAAGSLLARAGQHKAAIDALQPVFLPASQASESQQKLATQLCLYLGSEALSANQPALAAQAYGLAAWSAPPDVHPTAMLGAAWAVAMQRTAPVEAAEQLAAFVESYPQHVDAPRAAALQVTCLRQAKRLDQADAKLAELLDRWPDSIAATQVIAHYAPENRVLPQVTAWLLERADKADFSGFSPSMTGTGLLAAAQTDRENAWHLLAGHLAATDGVGGVTSDTLQKLSDWKLDPYAQRLAAALIAPQPDAQAQAASREAACRWAGRHQLWSMLALASEASQPETDEPTRTAAIERLFAESLMQSGRPEDAQRWWNHLVDVRKADDFPTLLRCAETATALSDVPQAGARVEAARSSAGEDEARLALVDMLAADLDIRRLKFDQARATLEKVVQSSQSVATLRGRAQWMIGETHFLQENFVAAIEAYRRVEGIDPQGPWVSVALVQAGKSFEQLGRTREAAVCYSTLVSRFGDSQHASVARRRLAEITPNPASHSPHETIRR